MYAVHEISAKLNSYLCNGVFGVTRAHHHHGDASDVTPGLVVHPWCVAQGLASMVMHVLQTPEPATRQGADSSNLYMSQTYTVLRNLEPVGSTTFLKSHTPT